MDAAEVKRKTIARSPEQNDRWLGPEMETPGAANEFSLQRDIVINEILYHAPPLEARPAQYVEEPLMPMDAVWKVRSIRQCAGGLDVGKF